MESRAKKTYSILIIISLLLVGAVVLLAVFDVLQPIWIVAPVALGVIFIITILWAIFIRKLKKEKADFIQSDKHRASDEDAPQYKPYDPAKATASKEAIYCEYCEARMEPDEDVCSNCKKKRDRFAGMKLT